MLYMIALILHLIISVVLVLIILAQSSKGGLDSNLGGAAMNVFGGSGASMFLRKWTQILGLVFLGSCLLVAFLVKEMGSGTAIDEIQKRQQKLDTEETAPPAGQTQPANIPTTTE
ncbi:MAG: preprotein translocase subunit SecG [Candidatus Cloacimonetes bacterium]|nr:preprotein translocase subunit SecG [Candidatus Cloacimonadota bacterium]